MGLFGPVGSILDKLGITSDAETDEEKRQRRAQEQRDWILAGLPGSPPSHRPPVEPVATPAPTPTATTPSGVPLPKGPIPLDANGFPLGGILIGPEDATYLKTLPPELRMMSIVARAAGLPRGTSTIKDGKLQGEGRETTFFTENLPVPTGAFQVGEQIKILPSGKTYTIERDEGPEGDDSQKLYLRDDEVGSSRIHTVLLDQVERIGGTKRSLVQDENSFSAREEQEKLLRGQLEDYLHKNGMLDPDEVMDDDTFVSFMLASGLEPHEPDGAMREDAEGTIYNVGPDVLGNAPSDMPPALREVYHTLSNEGLHGQSIKDQHQLDLARSKIDDWLTLDTGSGFWMNNIAEAAGKTFFGAAKFVLGGSVFAPIILPATGAELFGKVIGQDLEFLPNQLKPLQPHNALGAALDPLVHKGGAGDMAVQLAESTDRLIGVAVASALMGLSEGSDDLLGTDIEKTTRDIFTNRIAGEEVWNTTAIDATGIIAGLALPVIGFPKILKTPLTAARFARAALSAKPAAILRPLRAINMSRLVVRDVEAVRVGGISNIGSLLGPGTAIKTAKTVNRYTYRFDYDYAKRLLENRAGIMKGLTGAKKTETEDMFHVIGNLVEAHTEGRITSDLVPSRALIPEMSARIDRMREIEIGDMPKRLEMLENIRSEITKATKSGEEFGDDLFKTLTEEGLNPQDVYRKNKSLLSPEGRPRTLGGAETRGGRVRGWIEIAQEVVRKKRDPKLRLRRLETISKDLKQAKLERSQLKTELARQQEIVAVAHEAVALKQRIHELEIAVAQSDAVVTRFDEILGAADQYAGRIERLEKLIDAGVVPTRKGAKGRFRKASDEELVSMKRELKVQQDNRAIAEANVKGKEPPELADARLEGEARRQELSVMKRIDVVEPDTALTAKAKQTNEAAKAKAKVYVDNVAAQNFSPDQIKEDAFMVRLLKRLGITERAQWDMTKPANVKRIQKAIESLMGDAAPVDISDAGKKILRGLESRITGHTANITRMTKEAAGIRQANTMLDDVPKALMEFLNGQNFISGGKLVRFRNFDEALNSYAVELLSPGGRRSVVRSVPADDLTLPLQKRVARTSDESTINVAAVLSGDDLPQAEESAKALMRFKEEEKRLADIEERVGGEINPANLPTEDDARFLAEALPEQWGDFSKAVANIKKLGADGPQILEGAKEALTNALKDRLLEARRNIDDITQELDNYRRQSARLRKANLPEMLVQSEDEVNVLTREYQEHATFLLASTNPDALKQWKIIKQIDPKTGDLVDTRVPIFSVEGDIREALGARGREQLDWASGVLKFIKKPPPGTASKATIAKHFKQISQVMSSYADRVGMMDEMYLPVADNLFNKMLLSANQKRELMLTMVKTDLGVIEEASSAKMGLKGKFAFMRRASGQVLESWGQTALAMLDNRRMASEWALNITAGSYQHNLGRIAEAAGIPGRTKAARVANMFRRGFNKEGYKKFILENHHVDDLPLNEAGERFVPDDLVDWVASSPFSYMLQPQFWDSTQIPQEVKRMTAQMTRAYNDLKGTMEVEGMTFKGESILSHLLEPSLRDATGVAPADDLNQFLINTYARIGEFTPSEARRFSLLKTKPSDKGDDFWNVRSILGESALPEGQGDRVLLPFHRVLRTTEDQLSGVMATMHRRIITRNFMNNVYDKYVLDQVKFPSVASVFSISSDGSFRFAQGGKSAIKGVGGVLGKNAISDKSIAKDLELMMEMVSGGHKGMLGTAGAKLADVSKNIAMGRLIADASILGVQTPMYLAINLLDPTNFTTGFAGWKRAGKFFQNAIKLMDDEEWFTWVHGNQDELGMYIRKGFRMGTQAFVGGEFQPTWWLEHVPLVGGIGRGISNLNDIQFTRWLAYMKVDAIRQHMQVYSFVSKHPRIFGQFMKDVDGFQRVNESLGGKYFSSTKDEVMEATIRLVNNQFGGLSKAQYGTGAWREMMERILLIVPGFFRARTGVIVQSLSKPHTLEGQLAISIMARELAFAGSVGFMGSMAMGKEDEFIENFLKGPQAGATRFLAMQGPGFSISTMPNAASLTAFSRLVTGGTGGFDVIENVKKNPIGRLKTFQVAWESRMSPMTSSIYQTLKKEDFLGRRYDSTWDALLEQAQVVSPIFVEQALGAARETGFSDPARLATQTVAEFAGRSYRPQSAQEKLDDLIQEYFPGSEWRSLESHQKERLRLIDSDIAEWEEEWFKEISARQSDLKRTQGEILDTVSNLREDFYKEQLSIGGTYSSQQEDDMLVEQGAMAHADWLDRFQARQKILGDRYHTYDTVLQEIFEAESFDEVQRKWGEEFGENLIGGSDVWLLHRELGLLDIEEEAYSKQVLVRLDSGGSYPIRVIDYDKFRLAEEAIYAQYPEDVQAEVRTQLEHGRSQVRRDYDTANAELDTYLQMPKYRSFSLEQGEQIDNYRTAMSQAISVLRSNGLAADVVAGKTVRTALLKSFINLKLIKTPEDVALAIAAWEMENDHTIEVLGLSQDRGVWAKTHPLMLQFYPWTAGTIPTPFKGSLPEGVAPEIDLQPFTNPEAPF